MTEPISPAELEGIQKALSRAPREFRERLTRLLAQAWEDEAEGSMEFDAQFSGRGDTRTIRTWEMLFRAKGRQKR